MSTAALAGLISGLTALVTAVGTLVKLFQHVNSANPHPAAAATPPPPPVDQLPPLVQ